MKPYPILCVLVVWVLTISVVYGQAVNAGSAEAERAMFEMAQQRAALDRAWEKYHAKYQKDVESGRDLFGADARWGTSSAGKRSPKKEFEGTLAEKIPPDFRVGDWGCIVDPFQVVSRVSDTECLVMIKYYRYREGKIADLDSERILENVSEAMLLRGLGMSKVMDGAEFVLQHPVMIEDTFRYTAVSGSQKTVLVLECGSNKLKEKLNEIDMRLKAQQEAEAEQARAKKEQEAAAEAAKWRTWTIPDGVKVEAKFGGMIGRTVLLTKEDGSKLKVALTDLSAEDQEWIAERGK